MQLADCGLLVDQLHQICEVSETFRSGLRHAHRSAAMFTVPFWTVATRR